MPGRVPHPFRALSGMGGRPLTSIATVNTPAESALRSLLRQFRIQDLHLLCALNSFTAAPPPDRLASRISEYFLEKTTPSAPALKAANVASWTSSGAVSFSPWLVGMSISMPGEILHWPLTASNDRFVSRKT